MNRARLGGTGLVVASLWLAACDGSGALESAAGAGGGQSGTTSSATLSTGSSLSTGSGSACQPSCPSGQTCSDGSCVPLDTCGAVALTTNALPADLLIVLDRSCTMNDATAGGDLKWDVAVNALVGLIDKYGSKVRFGLTLFPDWEFNQGLPMSNGSCEQTVFPAPLSASSTDDARAVLIAGLAQDDPAHPGKPCVTNIDTGMQQAATDPGLDDPNRLGAVMLVTDGGQLVCNQANGDAVTEGVITDLYKNRGVPTYVVGFAPGASSTDKQALNEFALAGGVPRSDPSEAYYSADDAAELEATFDSIGSALTQCTLTLSPPPEDPSKVYVFFDDAEVSRDPAHASGWDYNASTHELTFYGSACEAIKASSVHDVDVVFGCPTPTPD